MPSAAEIRAVLAKAAERVQFSASSHRYKVDGKHSPAVTTITAMQHRPQLERWKIREQARGTALACFHTPARDHEAAEVYAARMMALAQKQFEADRIADEAANIGTQAHSLIEWTCRERIGQPTPRPTVGDQAEALFDQWLAWAEAEAFEVVSVEQRLFSSAGYCGTMDLLAFVKGRLTVADWKSKASDGKLWPDNKLQSVAYRRAVWEILSDAGIVLPEWPAGLILVLPRDGGKPQPIPVDGDPEADFEAFLALLKIYRWSKSSA